MHGCTAQAQKEVDTAKQLVTDEKATLAKTQTKLDSATTKLDQVADRVDKAEAAKAEEGKVRAIARALCIVRTLIAMHETKITQCTKIAMKSKDETQNIYIYIFQQVITTSETKT